MLLTATSFAQTPESELQALIQNYAKTYTRGDAAALGMLYADDALLLPPDRAMISGRSDISAFWKQSMGGKLTLTPVMIRADGNVGYIVGRFAFGAEAPSGKFTVCAIRGPSGNWLISADMWNQDYTSG
jgi:ketosteroid isomerase-like protein